jgi:HD-GYP domain-containing protein (c-di-GMP phosphodiesterase class II)
MFKLRYSGSEEILKKLMQSDAGKKWDQIYTYHFETAMHSQRVCLLCIDIGYENGLYKEIEINPLGSAGLLHDIGKLDIPLEILNKKSVLTDEEMEIVMKHSRLGFQRLKGNKYRTVRKTVVASHEYSINPYPRSGNDRRKIFRGIERRKNDVYIKECAQILAVSDICDALESERSYKGPMTKGGIEKVLIDGFTGDRKYINQVLARYRI